MVDLVIGLIVTFVFLRQQMIDSDFACILRCSSGGHGKAQTVTWTGILNSRRSALGLKIDWAYSPGEVKILTSSDGANFEEAKCWQPSTDYG